MELKTKCPWCDQEYVIDSTYIGQIVTCEKCSKEFTARKIAVPSSPSNFLEQMLSSSKTGTPSPLKPAAHQKRQFPVHSLNPNRNQERQSFQPKPVSPEKKSERPKGGRSWIKDFIDFKIMVTPSLVRTFFVLFFVVGALVLLIWPIVLMRKSIDVNETGRIVESALVYIVYIILGIPLWAIILHMSYELLMIPFLILNTLQDIQNKMDKNTNN